MEAKIFTDGASFPNPGNMGIGVVIWKGRKLVKEVSAGIGGGTNNIAEYSAVLRALHEAKKLGFTIIDLRTDSQLIVRQLNGEYKVKDPELKKIYKKVKELEKEFDNVSFTWIPRKQNKNADKLANDAALDK